MAIKKIIAVLLFTLTLQVQAEKIRTECDLYAETSSYAITAVLHSGCPLFLNETPDDRITKVYLKLWVRERDIRHGKTKIGAVLYDDSLHRAATIKTEHFVIESEGGPTKYYIPLKGYIYSDRIDPRSYPELVLAELLDDRKGIVDSFTLADYLSQFPFEEKLDTNGFRLLFLKEQGETRLSLAFKENRLVAVIPKRKMELIFYEARLNQQGLKIFYFENLSDEDEEFFVNYFAPR